MNGLRRYRLQNYLRHARAVPLFVAVGLLTLTVVLTVTLLIVRSHGTAQLALQTRDSANALSVALRPFMPDISAQEEEQLQQAKRREILLRALAQAGGYRQLAIADLSGNERFTYEIPPSNAGVPRWFVSLVEIDAPKYRAEITVGWDIAGFIAVSRQSTPVYRTLWQCAQCIAGAGFAGLILALILVGVRARTDCAGLPQWMELTLRKDEDRNTRLVARTTEQALVKTKGRPQKENTDAGHELATQQRHTCPEQISDD